MNMYKKIGCFYTNNNVWYCSLIAGQSSNMYKQTIMYGGTLVYIVYMYVCTYIPYILKFGFANFAKIFSFLPLQNSSL